MKSAIVIVAGLFFSLSALCRTVCETTDTINLERSEKLKLKYEVASNIQIQNIMIVLFDIKTGTFHKVIGQAKCMADPNYNPSNLKAKLFSRFDLSENKIDDYDLFLPKNISQLNTFEAYLTIAFDHSRPVTRQLQCRSVN